jgi:sugar O-acyltransferase (sialic acid O-acetyltransferase NeuD family)
VRLVLYGVSSPYAAEALETARRLDWEVAAAVRNMAALPAPAEIADSVTLDDLAGELRALPFLVPLIGPGHRHAAVADARANGFDALASMVDPTAVVARTSTLGPGTYVNSGVLIAAGVSAGSCCSFNRGASVGHHSRLGSYVTLGPGAITGGGCVLRDGCFLGVGAVLAPEVEIGANSVVGAGAVVVADVPANTTVVGNPARPTGPTAGYGSVGVPADA